jgi:hypothetical protein
VNRSVAQVFKDADVVMTPILGKPLTSYIFADAADPEAMKRAELTLMQTAITQPAMLTMDTALYKLLAEYGFAPDMVMGHSLGEYAALIAAGIMPFADALEASAARGAEMTKVSMDDNGWMAAVMAPLEVVEATLKEVDGYAVAANINSYNQAVVGGASKAVEQAIGLFEKKGFRPCASPSATPSTPRSWRRPASRCARCSTGCASANPSCRWWPTSPATSTPRRSRASRTSWNCRSPRRCSGSRGWRRCTRGRAHLCRGRPQARAQGLRRRRAGQQARRLVAAHQPSEERRNRELQPGAVRAVRRRLWGGGARGEGRGARDECAVVASPPRARSSKK